MALKTVIIDDEKIAIKSLENLCKKVATLDLKASFEDPIEALNYVTKESIDLMLLDIEMPELTGLELLDKLPSLPQVIFTTSNKEYAYEAFEYEVTDFIKKPITKDRFLKSIQKAVNRDSYLKEIARDSNLREIYVRVDGRLVRISIDDILYFENVGDYVKVITVDKVHVINIALKHLHVKLNHPRLLKVHRSYIVNMDKIKDIQENTLVINKKVIPISRAHKAIVMNAINIIN